MDFGITPDQVAQIVGRWRHAATELAGLDTETGEFAVSGSFTLDALAGAVAASGEAGRARSHELGALADALVGFNTCTVDSDEAAAAALAATRRLP